MLIALDTETGGLDAAVNPLLELTLWNPKACFSERVYGMARPCEQKALAVNGLSPDMGGHPKDVAERLLAWWKGMGSPRFELVGHNVGPFDVPFTKQLTCYGVDLPWDLMFDYHYRDTAVLALILKDLGLYAGKLQLAAFCAALNIRFTPHQARQDAMATWHAWERGMLILARHSPQEFSVLDLNPSA